MRTITEFFGRNLITASEKLGEWNEGLKKDVTEKLKAEGKTDEEITAGLDAAVRTELEGKVGAEFKLEGEKAAMFMAALSLVGGKKGSLKRVIVMAKSNDTENAPAGAQEIDGKFYSVEMFPEGRQSQAPVREERGGRGGKGGRGGRGGRDDKKGGGRGPRGDRDGGRKFGGAPTGGTPGKIVPKGDAAPAAKPAGDAT